jgi:hypothetical protein
MRLSELAADAAPVGPPGPVRQGRLELPLDFIANADFSREDDLCQHALATLGHQRLQTGSDAVHFVARSSRLVKKQHRPANFHFTTKKGGKLDAGDFYV